MLDLESIILPLSAFAFVTTITPGPVNLMITASGANYGFIRTLPFVLGTCIGFFCLQLSIASGLGILFHHYPSLQLLLKIAGSVYLLHLAWKIASAAISNYPDKKEKPITFIQASLFQFLNPKAWLMAITAMATFPVADQHYLMNASLIAAIFSLINLPSAAAWACFGISMRRFLRNSKSLRYFNLTMATLVVCTIIFMFY